MSPIESANHAFDQIDIHLSKYDSAKAQKEPGYEKHLIKAKTLLVLAISKINQATSSLNSEFVASLNLSTLYDNLNTDLSTPTTRSEKIKAFFHRKMTGKDTKKATTQLRKELRTICQGCLLPK